MNRTFKTLVFWFFIVFTAWFLWQSVRSKPANASVSEIEYSAFISQAEAGKIAGVTVTGTHIDGEYRDGKGTFQLTGPSNPAVYLGILQDMGVEIRFRDAQTNSLPLQLLGTWAPLILLGALWFLMIRQMRRRNAPPNAMGGTVDPSGGLR
ncbi:MAG TPA: ATP-dependent metallopeptidase FtsH/Yme1/Tma family protein [Terriglobales bacterium]|nr:ATP-dependent metallopeptidase FtsH/Yme1/Tma family protein [Terriglobales bacterium]